MSQHDLNCEVCRATSESVRSIAEMGFVDLSSVPVEHEPLLMDWDEQDAERNVAVIPQGHRR